MRLAVSVPTNEEIYPRRRRNKFLAPADKIKALLMLCVCGCVGRKAIKIRKSSAERMVVLINAGERERSKNSLIGIQSDTMQRAGLGYIYLRPGSLKA